MMKIVSIFIIIIFFQLHSYTQSIVKPALDSSAINMWQKFDYKNPPKISDDGKYFMYGLTTSNPVNPSSNLVIQSVDRKWVHEISISNSSSAVFTSDSRYAIYLNRDTLFILELGTKYFNILPNVKSFKKANNNPNEWIICKLANNKIILRNLHDEREFKLDSIADFSLDNGGNALLLKSEYRSGRGLKSELKYFDMKKGELRTIWQGNNMVVGTFALSQDGQQIAFLTSSEGNQAIRENSIWYATTAMKNPQLIKAAIEQSLRISNSAPRFSNDGKYIYLKLESALEASKPIPGAASVDIWNYKDAVLQSSQLLHPIIINYDAVIKTDTKEIICLENDDNEVIKAIGHDYVVVGQNVEKDRFWLSSNALDSNWIVSLRDGTRKFLLIGNNLSPQFFFSPKEKYLIYYSSKEQSYFSYEISTQKVYNISNGIPEGSLCYLDEYKIPNRPEKSPVGIAAWIENDMGMLVYDNFDIWKLYLNGKMLPTNLTNRFGKLNGIKFRLLGNIYNEHRIVSQSERLLLCAFNTITMYNGFFETNVNSTKHPTCLTLGPYTYIVKENMLPIASDMFDYGMEPIKSKSANQWVVMRQSALEAPNYFITSNFKNFTPLTSNYQEKKYNWLSAELISFKLLNGLTSRGVLYRPENFDSTIKYPILFTYYRQSSHRLFNFPYPEFTHSVFNIPWFVSRGYLVFTPDIYFNIDSGFGKSALNSVIGAALHFSKIPFVDSNRMGINGHSVAGGLTNYIITHSNLFAAAISGAGVSDPISSSLTLSRQTGRSRMAATESYAYNGATIWERPDMYLENSTVLNAHNITTPVVFLHCQADGAVPWSQSIEIFSAMWRMHKPSWLLQYDNGTHVLSGLDCIDYTIRITQFFDHYLKGLPAPKWMTRGIPAKLKTIDKGFDLDLNQCCNERCSICNKYKLKAFSN